MLPLRIKNYFLWLWESRAPQKESAAAGYWPTPSPGNSPGYWADDFPRHKRRKGLRRVCIWPVDGDDNDATRRAYDQLVALLGPSRIVRTSGNQQTGINFWEAELNAEQFVRIAAMSPADTIGIDPYT
ncbi:hypothetical protein TOPH_03876 [Tolypocladium ophioglossoides CBS 100239]|uniref:Uncharacterized protein n=1 Tax=Tolypocladium ophioglossoides (strain CBS 100239) TaxID=1163406 RepID=A0A0L0NCA8_TOLOC|nr:hypothetical protein TOPH_03876 [Tolypocladium ophioglossoides CBS 100239]